MACVFYFHQKSFNCELLYAGRFPENPFRVSVDVEVTRLDMAMRAGFFPGFFLCCLTMRHVGLCSALGKCPFVAAVGIYQQEFHRNTSTTVAHRSYLERQSEFGQTTCSHGACSVKFSFNLRSRILQECENATKKVQSPSYLWGGPWRIPATKAATNDDMD